MQTGNRLYSQHLVISTDSPENKINYLDTKMSNLIYQTQSLNTLKTSRLPNKQFRHLDKMSKAGNTHGTLNLPLHASVYGTLHHSKHTWHCAPDPLAVSPSKWAKAEHAVRLLILRINIWSGWGKCVTISWQREANCSMSNQIQHASVYNVRKCVPSLTHMQII